MLGASLQARVVAGRLERRLEALGVLDKLEVPGQRRAMTARKGFR